MQYMQLLSLFSCLFLTTQNFILYNINSSLTTVK